MHENQRYFGTGMEIAKNPHAYALLVGIIILNIFPIDFHVKTKNFLFSVTLL